MPMRVAIAGIHTETNTFSPVPADFSGSATLRGEEIVDELATAHHAISGFLEACRDEPVEVVPLVYGNAWACGAMTAETFERLAAEIVDAVVAHGPFDVVLLAQHGAAVADGCPDADGELIARVRAAVGADVLLAAELDLHGNITDRVIDNLDVAVGYRENPHRDPRLRGAECAALALRTARGEVQPVHRLLRLPMVVPILGGWTETGAMRDVMADAERIAADYELLSFSVFHGFGYADVPHMGSSVLTVADAAPETAERAARDIAACLWRRREELRGEALSPADAIAEADWRADGNGPVVVMDVGDNIGGGSPADSTVLLAHAVERGVQGFVATVCDTRAVDQALAAGEGADVELDVGATTPVSAGPRLRLRGRVTRITDGHFADESISHGGFRSFDGGPTVRLTTEAGPELIITSTTVPTFTPEQLRAVGLEPRDQRVIVAKGVVAPRAGYAPVAAEFLLADTPGVTVADLTQLDHRQRPRPMWPFEPDTHYEPAEHRPA
jgi:microcystin degradation protein MlrC